MFRAPLIRSLFPASTLLALILAALLVLVYVTRTAGPNPGIRIASEKDAPAAISLPPDLRVELSLRAENYTVSSAQAPYFTQAVIDPREVQLGEVQRLLVRIKDEGGVKDVVATTELDTTTLTLPLTLIWGDANDGIWSNSWTVTDTHDRHYATRVAATNTRRQKNSIDLVWKDPHGCDGELSGAWTVAVSCSTSGVGGADAGNITVNTGVTLTVTAATTVGWNSGYSITNNGNLAIGGQLRQTNIWIKDADNDGHAPNATDQLAQDAQPSTYQRRSTRTGIRDCYDLNASTTPDDTAYYTTNRGDGSFDYNCNSVENKWWNGAATSCAGECCSIGSNPCASGTIYRGSNNNGSTIACGSVVTTSNDGTCGGGACIYTTPLQKCR